MLKYAGTLNVLRNELEYKGFSSYVFLVTVKGPAHDVRGALLHR